MLGIEQNAGVYRITSAALLQGVTVRVLPHAVEPSRVSAPSDEDLQQKAYGLVRGGLTAPSRKDYYIVEFVEKRAFRLLAYLDAYGRVFSTDAPLSAPPVHSPQLQFSDFSARPTQTEQRGFVQVEGEKGETRQLAQYAHTRTSYRLFGSWYNFGHYARDLSYADALARAYLALIYRPKILGTSVPACGTEMVHAYLRGQFLLPALRSIVNEVGVAKNDQMMNPPALVCCLARWLSEAGVGATSEVEDDRLGLVHTRSYAKLYFVTEQKKPSGLTRPSIWTLESALNRFLLLEQKLGDELDEADEAKCLRMETALFEAIESQPPDPSEDAALPTGQPGGEWEMRCRIAAGIERLKLPIRVEISWCADAEKGVVVFDILAPGSSLMPSLHTTDHQCALDVSTQKAEDKPTDQARTYALRVGRALAEIAFGASNRIEEVVLGAHLLLSQEASKTAHRDASLEVSEPGGDELLGERVEPCYSATFSRHDYECSEGFKVSTDNSLSLAQSKVCFDSNESDIFSSIRAFSSFLLRNELPESCNKKLSESASFALGAKEARDVRIVYHAYLRHLGEELADKVVRAQNTSEAIHGVRESQEAAHSRGDDSAVMACTRLMASLAKGEIEGGDQNAVVACFLGEDRCMSALSRAQLMAETDLPGAVAVLREAVSSALTVEGFKDSQTEVYRAFDSYASRIWYNRALSHAHLDQKSSEYAAALKSFGPSLMASVRADVGKKVLLVPDSFYLCHLELTNLLGRSFDHAEEALEYGRRAVQMAPTVTGSYRQLARVYVLVGDMTSAIETLTACLRVATQKNDVAVAYYQLAYALWKAGNPRAGATCYLKSIATSPVMALQAMTEFKELVLEQDIDLAKGEAVDETLNKLGILIAPTKEAVSSLEAAAVSAVDVGLFPVARDVLSLWLQYHPDDALVNVLRSLNT